MRPFKLYILNFLFIILTVPWFFLDDSINSIFGFPFWAFYSLIMTFLYAIIIYLFLKKYWFVSVSLNEDDD